MFTYTAAVLFHVTKGNPFSTWGETVFILIQNIFLVLLLWYYRKDSATAIVSYVMVYGLITAILAHVPRDYDFLLMGMAMSCSALSRLPQIMENYKQSQTGVLSPEVCVCCSLSLAVTRIFLLLPSSAPLFVSFLECLDLFLLCRFVLLVSHKSSHPMCSTISRGQRTFLCSSIGTPDHSSHL